MDERKAIERINRFMMWMSDGTKEALHLSVKALEKQMPRKVIKIEDIVSQVCPICKSKVNWTYCSNCGQKLTY